MDDPMRDPHRLDPAGSAGCPWSACATEYVRGELRPRQRHAFAAHLAVCQECSALSDDLGDICATLRADAPPLVAERRDVAEAVLGRIPMREWSRPHRARRRLAAAAAVAAAAVFLLWSRLALAPSGSDPGGAPAAGRAGDIATSGVDPVRDARGWLASVQEADGSWNPQRWGGDADYRIAITGLALLALRGDEEPRSHDVAAAAAAGRFLVRTQAPDGHLGRRSRSSLYNHAIGTLALVELAGAPAAGDALAGAARQAVAFLGGAQRPGGGWGASVERGTPENDSISVWALRAISRARTLGVGHDPAAIDAAVDRGVQWFVERLARAPRRSLHAAGSSAYGATEAPLTASALLMHPDRLDDRRVRDAVDDLLVATRQPLLETFCFYDAYFLIEAAADARSAALARVQESTRRALVGTQVRSGPNRGSWDPTDRWSPVGGRIYTTALAALTLRVRAPRAAAWNG